MTDQPLPTNVAAKVDRIRESKGLGRLQATDSRDRAFPMRAVVEHVDPFTKYWPFMRECLDQGATSQCVAYSWTHFLLAAPTTHKAGSLGAFAAFCQALYDRAQRVDEWPGEDYDGTSVRAGAKVLSADQRLTEYRWAWDATTARDYVLTRGPIVFGTNWYERMFIPDAGGYLRPEGEVAGGHAYLVLGYSRERHAFRMVNSWGVEWGQKGRAWLSFDVAHRLLQEDGECASGVEQKPVIEVAP